MIPNQCIEVQTSPEARFSVPPWFAEVVMVAQYLATNGLLEAFGQPHGLRNEMYIWLKCLRRLVQYPHFFWEEFRNSSALWKCKSDKGCSRATSLLR